MTDNEIIKALECCIKSKCAYDCEKLGCSAYRTGKCVYVKRAIRYEDFGIELMKDALDLIERQQAEIERLKGEVDMYEEERKYHFEMSKQQTAEAIKEFAEKIMAFYYEFYEVIPSIIVDKIDNLVKEMTEGV